MKYISVGKMAFIPIRFKRFVGFGIKRVEIEGLTIFAFRFGLVGFQINYGSLSDESTAGIGESLEAVKAGKVKPWSQVKKELNIS